MNCLDYCFSCIFFISKTSNKNSYPFSWTNSFKFNVGFQLLYIISLYVSHSVHITLSLSLMVVGVVFLNPVC